MAFSVELFGFSSVESPEKVKLFVEELTGEGSVCSVEFGQQKPGSRAHAKVQFMDFGSKATIMSQANNKDRLWYGDSWLKARDLNATKQSESFLCTMDDIMLHFGCRVSDEKFSVLWTSANVRVKFGQGLRKLYFFFSYKSLEYKLELSFDSIRQIELRCCPCGDRATKFLLLQLFGGPKIYQRQFPSTYWVRDIDFTPSCAIGQSSSICVEIPIDRQLPDLSDGFVHYREDQGPFCLEKKKKCSLFSSTSGLIPMVVLPEGVNLPYKILFKLNSLVQHGCISGEALDDKLFSMVDPAQIRPEYIVSALDKLYHLKLCCYDPLGWLETEYNNYEITGRIPASPSISLEEGLVYVHRVQITPTKVYCCGPEINISNRVLRNYPNDIENFLRVTFVDEDWDRLHSKDLSLGRDGKGRTRVYQRLLSVVSDGIVIGGKRFEFLAFSSSQLRESSAWMFASRDGLGAEEIREWMGDFRPIRNVAKYAARLGQSFGSSRETLTVRSREVDFVPDVETGRGESKHCFSDGIGKISPEFAGRVAAKCGLDWFTPSAFQIRYGGFKGVVAVDPTSEAKLSLRGSMRKYESEGRKVDVLGWSRYQPCFLNRQVITLLSTLGVGDRVFVKKQKEAVRRLDAILAEPSRAREELALMFPGEIGDALKEMLACGYHPATEPFLSSMLRTLRDSMLIEIRTKSRIYVRHGRALMGCMDETGTLEYGEVFVQCSRPSLFNDASNTTKLIISGSVVVAKNPCLHPGDVRVLSAVDVPELRHMVDCVVFPQKGKRPHPNECSGSDLDGDMYFVCWDRDLIPPHQVEPMDYTPAEAIELDHDVTIEEVKKYFVDYILDDKLGIISNAHTVHADRLPKMARSKLCLELAKLFPTAVDFPKTGVPAKILPHLRAKEYPDFMENPHKPSYRSSRVIGKLFRQAKDLEEFDGSTSIKPFYDSDMEVDGFEDYVTEAFDCKSEYDRKLGYLMEYFGFETEAELLSGNVVKGLSRFRKKRDLESVTCAVKSLIREARVWFGNEDRDGGLCAKRKASAWYYVTYHPSYWGRYNQDTSWDHFLSFAWCVFDKLVSIKSDKFRS